MPGPTPPPPGTAGASTGARPLPTHTPRLLNVPEGTPGTLHVVARGEGYAKIVGEHGAYGSLPTKPTVAQILAYNQEKLGSQILNASGVDVGDQIFLPTVVELGAFLRARVAPGHAGATTGTGAATGTDSGTTVVEDRGRTAAGSIQPAGTVSTGGAIVAPAGTYGGVGLGQPSPPAGGTARGAGDLFNYVDGASRPFDAERPGYFGGIIRGTESKPVFGRGGNWFTRGTSDAGNWIMDQAGSGLSGLVHEERGTRVDIPITDDLILGFSASGRKVREDEIPPGDPRRLGIEELRQSHPGALPIWIEGKFGQDLSFNLGHSVPIGTAGYVNFGFTAGEAMQYRMQRLAYLPGIGDNIKENDQGQLQRLALGPMSASEVARMETGATFAFTGNANLRVDAALGLGGSIPALSNVLRVGGGVEVGAYASLGGEMSLQLQRLEQGRARVTLSSLGTASAGAHLRLWGGVEVNHQELTRLLRGFVDYVADGGDPEAFKEQLSNEHERKLADNMAGYMRLLCKNLAEGTGTAVMDSLVERYATAYLEARGGIDIASNFSTSIDFDLNNTATVQIPRADMVPEDLRNGVAANQPLTIEVGQLARLAYDMAVHGDLRLVQQLTLLRNSGVRINERVTTSTTGTSSEIELQLPFIHYRRAGSTTRTVTDRYTPELGRTRTAIESFSREYQGIFGHQESSAAEVRVHTPHGKGDAEVFFGSDENFSADLVLQNKVEPWTSFDDMQDFVGVLNSLSNGRLEGRIREALGEGEFREKPAADLWEALFCKPREYGRTIAHVHVWLGEEGLRELLSGDLRDDQLYAAIGPVFANMSPGGGTQLPEWAEPGAARAVVEDGEQDVHQLLFGDSIIRYGGDDDLSAARYLVDNIKRLSLKMRAAKTPAEEEVVAGQIRNFLRDCEDKLPAYAALASLVPEQHRAVEMRLTSIRRDKAPIRFTYLQDGRASELLYATGFARMAMKQYQRYQAVLDTETRLRLGSLLGEMHQILNSPSPDPYRLEVAMKALDGELGRMDARAVEMGELIAADLGRGRAFLDGIPDAHAIQALLPGPVGTELATLRLNALRLLNAPQPDLLLLRSTFQNILSKMPLYRRVETASNIVGSTARLANDLAESHEDLADDAKDAVDDLREAIRDGDSDEDFQQALTAVTAVHTRLLEAAGDAAGTATSAVEDPPVTSGGVTGGVDPYRAPGSAADMANARGEAGERYRALAGNPAVAPVSYFERTGVVPAFYMGTPYESGGEGIVTGSMVRDAELAMASSRPSGELEVPPLAQSSVDRLVALATSGKAEDFLTAIEAAAFEPAVVIEDPGKQVLEYLLVDIPHDQRRTFLRHFSPERQSRLERIFAELDSTKHVEERRPDSWARDRQYFLRENKRFADDLTFIEKTLADDPKNLEAVINTLTYGRTIDNWHAVTTARLEGVLSQLSGDQLNGLVGKMGKDERARFHHLVRNSDLRPQTRAKLAGGIVDNRMMWRQQEELVEALVTGMNAADLRIFFDQLYKDGKLEDFLEPSSFWRTLLVVFSFGLALLWLHDNEAALRVCASQGWSVDELTAHYSRKYRFLAGVERDAEAILFNATVDTIPMDPAIRGSVKVLHTIIGNVKYYHFADLPEEAGRLLKEMAKGAGKQLVLRIGDIAKQGGSVEEIAAEYKRFFAGLSPSAISQQLESGDLDGSAALVSKALADGAVAGLINAAFDPRNRFLTPDVLLQIIQTTNKLDDPVSFEAGGFDPRIDEESYRQLCDKWEFFKQYTGFDYRDVQLLYGGFATAAPAVAFGPTISISPDSCPTVDGKITIDDNFQQVIAFHESSHTMQQMMYGARVNAFIDQGFAIAGGSDRGEAYRVTQEMFDRAESVHDFQHHWEQQAELVEQSLRLLWSRRVATGSNSPAIYESYVPGQKLEVAGSEIELTPERWAKMLSFLAEFGDASRTSLGEAGGHFEFAGTH